MSIFPFSARITGGLWKGKQPTNFLIGLSFLSLRFPPIFVLSYWFLSVTESVFFVFFSLISESLFLLLICHATHLAVTFDHVLRIVFSTILYLFKDSQIKHEEAKWRLDQKFTRNVSWETKSLGSNDWKRDEFNSSSHDFAVFYFKDISSFVRG